MKIFITGGAGYCGTVLSRNLTQAGHDVTVYDTCWFWDDPNKFSQTIGKSNLIIGDIRDRSLLRSAMRNHDVVYNLACISNDPSNDLDTSLAHDVSYNGVLNVIDVAKDLNIPYFIHASTSSVYGLKQESNVTEDLKPEPITQYAQIKLEIEHVLSFYAKHRLLNNVIIRPATVAGASSRQRLDVILNIFASQAMKHGRITIFGGSQWRPNIDIQDICFLYKKLLDYSPVNLNGKIYNVGDQNMTVAELAAMVSSQYKTITQKELEIEHIKSNDNRSYRLDSSKVLRELGFKPFHGLKTAVFGLMQKLARNEEIVYPNNMERMKELILSGSI